MFITQILCRMNCRTAGIMSRTMTDIHTSCKQENIKQRRVDSCKIKSSILAQLIFLIYYYIYNSSLHKIITHESCWKRQEVQKVEMNQYTQRHSYHTQHRQTNFNMKHNLWNHARALSVSESGESHLWSPGWQYVPPHRKHTTSIPGIAKPLQSELDRIFESNIKTENHCSHYQSDANYFYK